MPHHQVKPPSESDPDVAIRLVLGVARLGEADLAGWWSSQGLNPAVRFALAGFRRTGPVVGAELALLSAVRRHQQVLPRPNAVHLFSPYLPFVGWARARLAEMKSTGHSDLLDELRTWGTVPQATDQISTWLHALRAAPDLNPSVTLDELADPANQHNLLVGLTGKYLSQSDALLVPYVDLSQ